MASAYAPYPAAVTRRGSIGRGAAAGGGRGRGGTVGAPALTDASGGSSNAAARVTACGSFNSKPSALQARLRLAAAPRTGATDARATQRQRPTSHATASSSRSTTCRSSASADVSACAAALAGENEESLAAAGAAAAAVAGGSSVPREASRNEQAVRAQVSRQIRQYGRDGNLTAAIEAFTAMQVEGIAPDAMAATALIDCCVRCGEIARAERAFISLFAQSASSTSTSASTSTSTTSAPSSAATASSAVSSSSSSSAVSSSGSRNSSSSAAPLRPDAVVVGVLLRAYGQRRPPQWGKIQQLLARMEAEFKLQPTAAIFNELVSICARDNEVERGMQLLERMAAVGVEPDDHTFEAVRRRRALRSHFKKVFAHLL